MTHWTACYYNNPDDDYNLVLESCYDDKEVVLVVHIPERNSQYISNLADFIRTEYNIPAHSLIPAKRGWYGETWRLNSDNGSYFIKIVYPEIHKPCYERSFPVVEYMNSHGIDSVSRIVKSANGSLYVHFDGASVGVFNWIDGDNLQNEYTKIQEYNTLAKIYAISTKGLEIPCETFGMESADLFYKQWDALKLNTNKNADLLRLLESNKNKAKRLSNRLLLFSERCKGNLSHRYITHGDAGGNVIVNGDHFHIVDWDEPVIAPPERDAWFCLHWDWAMAAFNGALRDNGIDYVLRPERLAYYCYNSFFWYLTKQLDFYFEYGDKSRELTRIIADDLDNSWIYENIKYADAHY